MRSIDMPWDELKDEKFSNSFYSDSKKFNMDYKEVRYDFLVKLDKHLSKFGLEIVFYETQSDSYIFYIDKINGDEMDSTG